MKKISLILIFSVSLILYKCNKDEYKTNYFNYLETDYSTKHGYLEVDDIYDVYGLYEFNDLRKILFYFLISKLIRHKRKM